MMLDYLAREVRILAFQVIITLFVSIQTIMAFRMSLFTYIYSISVFHFTC